MSILRTKITLNAVICMILYFFYNGAMTSPKHRILSFDFTVLCLNKIFVFILHKR